MKYLKGVLFVFNLLTWLAGCTVMSAGGWLLMDPSKGNLLNVFAVDASPHQTISFVAYCLFGLGFSFLAVGYFGCRAVFRGSRRGLAVYMSMQIALVVAEVVAAAVLGVVAYRTLAGLEARMAQRLASDFGEPGVGEPLFTDSLNYAQFKFNCCGIHSDLDYNGTAWWLASQRSDKRLQVPPTCCALLQETRITAGSPISVIYRVFQKPHENQWEKPSPRNETHCQSLSAKEHVGFRHKDGCLAKIKDWARSDSLGVIIFGLAVAVAQVSGTVTSGCLCRQAGLTPPRQPRRSLRRASRTSSAGASRRDFSRSSSVR